MDEEAYIISKELGIIKLKDIYIGIHVLSYNEKTKEQIYVKVLSKNISKSNCLDITLSNGNNIITSNKILSYNEKYFYKKPNIENVCIIPIKQDINNNYNSELVKIAWFIGAHIGDGTAGIIKNRNKLRFRILGDEENVVKEYNEILNKLCNTNVKYGVDSAKRYKSTVWSCCNTSKELINICKIYLDNQYGKKVYIAKTPSYIIKNNLWIPYIAGLIDSDGTIKENNTIQLDMCAKSIMVDVCNYLSSNGITHHFRKSKPTRLNESICYRIIINSNNIEFIKLLSTYMVHERKKSKLINNIYKPFSLKKYLSKTEANNILLKHNEQKFLNKHLNKKNMNACINLLRNDKNVGIGSLNVFKEFNFINEQKYNEILQRVYVKNISIVKDVNIVNLVLENNHNNIFVGNIGFISIKI